MSTQPDHNPDENGWCQNDGCMWNSWNAKSDPPCPTKLPKRAGTIQEQEELLHGRPPEPTGDAGEVEKQIEREFRNWFESGEEDVSSRRAAYECAEIAMRFITASNQAAEARGRRDRQLDMAAKGYAQHWRSCTKAQRMGPDCTCGLDAYLAALGDTNDHQ